MVVMSSFVNHVTSAYSSCVAKCRRAVAAKASKPTLPSSYTLPEVWAGDPSSMGGTFGAVNQPTAGARFVAPLPVGKKPLQLYSLGTPNGQKVTIMLYECLLDDKFDSWEINIGQLHQFSSGFVDVNPNSKIPALTDADGPGGNNVNVFETGSILLYLAEKTGKFIPTDPVKRIECMNWLMWNMGTAPYLGQFGHFYKYAPVHIEYGVDRYAMEAKRIVDVLDHLLENRQFIVGEEVTIADFAIFPWVVCLLRGYNAGVFLKLDSYTHVKAWCDRMMSRPNVRRGMQHSYGKWDPNK
ncbi:glutathione S-transferase [Pycnococcus provasolii]